MKKIKLLIFSVLTGLSLMAQETVYQKDLRHLYETLKKTPSYKEQIKGIKKQEHKRLYEELNRMIPGSRTIDTLYLYSRLLWPIKDNHLVLSQKPELELSMDKLSDTAFIKQYRRSAAFTEYPTVKINTDAIEASLEEKSMDSVEGIYHIGNLMKAAVYRTEKKDSLIGVVLWSRLPNWDKGQMVFMLKETAKNQFIGWYSNLITKCFLFVKNEKFLNGKLTKFGSKSTASDFTNLWTKESFLLKTISPDIQYLRLGNFSSSNNELKISQEFYDNIKDSIRTKNLIVDIRNNSGGGDKSSSKFVDLLKHFSRTGKIFVLVNNNTYSNAEQFAIKLKRLPNVIILGETTSGMLTYGNNYGTTILLPSGRFKLYITDMKDSDGFLLYEDVGIVPDVFLKPDKDWIQQTKDIVYQ